MLPIYQDSNKNMMLQQTNWASQINPILNNPLVNGQLLKNIEIVAGSNVINHLLSRQMQGYFVTNANAAATIYRSQPFNTQTLTLVSSAPVTIDLWVF